MRPMTFSEEQSIAFMESYNEAFRNTSWKVAGQEVQGIRDLFPPIYNICKTEEPCDRLDDVCAKHPTDDIDAENAFHSIERERDRNRVFDKLLNEDEPYTAKEIYKMEQEAGVSTDDARQAYDASEKVSHMNKRHLRQESRRRQQTQETNSCHYRRYQLVRQ